jgi:hypothetical protein
MKKPIKKKKSAKKILNPKQKLAKRKGPPKTATMKTRTAGKKAISGETAALLLDEVREKSRGLDTVAFPPEELGGRRSGELSGDLQGLSDIEDADSESVAELLEEGNAFEADVVKGVEDAPSPDTGPVRTHEVPEDDIPDEYRHKE